MNKQTKIIVLKQKKLIYGLLIIAAAILLVSILLLANSENPTQPSAPQNPFPYTAGVYSSTVVLNGNPVELKVTMDDNLIHHIHAVNISETAQTSYPLFNSCLEDIATQVISNNSTENVTYSTENKYTSMVLINAIHSAIEKSLAQSN